MTFNQLMKDRLKDDPDFEPTYIKRVPMSWRKMRKMFGMMANPKRRGRGYTKPINDTTKAQRKQAQLSRSINRK